MKPEKKKIPQKNVDTQLKGEDLMVSPIGPKWSVSSIVIGPIRYTIKSAVAVTGLNKMIIV